MQVLPSLLPTAWHNPGGREGHITQVLLSDTPFTPLNSDPQIPSCFWAWRNSKTHLIFHISYIWGAVNFLLHSEPICFYLLRISHDFWSSWNIPPYTTALIYVNNVDAFFNLILHIYHFEHAEPGRYIQEIASIFSHNCLQPSSVKSPFLILEHYLRQEWQLFINSRPLQQSRLLFFTHFKAPLVPSCCLTQN